MSLTYIKSQYSINDFFGAEKKGSISFSQFKSTKLRLDILEMGVLFVIVLVIVLDPVAKDNSRENKFILECSPREQSTVGGKSLRMNLKQLIILHPQAGREQ